MWKLPLLIVSHLLLFISSSVSATSYDEMYLKFFGSKPEPIIEILPLILIINNNTTTYINSKVDLNQNKLLSINSETLIHELSKFITNEGQTKFIDLTKNEWTDIQDLRDLGYTYNLDLIKNTLMLTSPVSVAKHIQIPLTQSKKNTYRLGNTIVPEFNTISGFFNFLPTLSSSLKGSSFNLAGNSKTTWREWTLESSFLMANKNQQTNFDFNKINLVRYYLPIESEVSIGFVKDTAHSFFHDGSELFGILFKKKRYIQPYSRVINKEIEAKLSTPSTLVVIHNKKKIFDKDLLPGNYLFSHFPESEGLNKIEIQQLSMDNALQSSTKYEYIYNASILKPNDIDFQVASGYAYTPLPLTQEPNKRFLSLYFKKGLTNQLAFGSFINQTDYLPGNRTRLGVQSDIASRFGLFTLDIAYSKNSLTHLSGFAFKQTLSSYQFHGPPYLPKRVQINTTQLGKGFEKDYQIHQTTIVTSFILPYNLNMAYQLGIIDQINARNTHGLTFSFSQFPLNYALNLNWIMTKNQPDNFNVAFSVNYNFKTPNSHNKTTLTGQTGSSGFHYIFRQFPTQEKASIKKHLIGFHSIKKNNRNHIETLTFKDSNLSTSVINMMKQSNSLQSINTQFLGNRFNSTNTITYLNSELVTFSSSVGFALAFVGKHVAISKPIQRSFVMIKPSKKLRSYIFTWDKGESNQFGPAIISDIQPYKTNLLSFYNSNHDSDTLNLDDLNYTVRPSYGSGILISVNDLDTVNLNGRLINVDGDPLKSIVGTLTSKNDHEFKHVFFTDEIGRFNLYNIPVGIYYITINKTNNRSNELNINNIVTNELLDITIYPPRTDIALTNKSVTKNKEIKIESTPVYPAIPTPTHIAKQIQSIQVSALNQPIIKSQKPSPTRVDSKPKQTKNKTKKRIITDYKQLTDHPYFDVFKTLQLTGLIDEGIRFRPNQSITRQYFSELVTTMLELKSDIYTSKSKNAQDYLIKSNILKDKTARGTMKRSEVIVALSRLTGYSESTPKLSIPLGTFIDVDNSHWCYVHLSHLLSQSIIKPSSYFYPNKVMTQSDLISIIINFPSVSKSIQESRDNLFF